MSIVRAHSREDRSRVGRLSHLLRLRIHPILDMGAIAAQLLQKLDNLGDFVFAQDCELERQGVPMRVQFILVRLGDKHEHDDEDRK